MNDNRPLSAEVQAAVESMVLSMLMASRQQRLQSFAVLNQFAAPGGIVLLGDSITEGFPILEMYRGSQRIYNRGVAGDTTRDVLRRLEESVVAVAPAKVFLMIGTNDIDLEQGAPADEIVARIEEICTSIQTRLPQVRIHVLSIPPVRPTEPPVMAPLMVRSRTNEKIRSLNVLIGQASRRLRILYLDVFSRLIDADGELRGDYTTDGLHLTAEGYLAILEILLPYLEG